MNRRFPDRLQETTRFYINPPMKKSAILSLTLSVMLLLSLPVCAADWDRDHHRRDDRSQVNNIGNWYAGYWWYGTHGDGGGWWWVTPGGGYHLFPQPVYPYPEPPIPLPPPMVVTAPPGTPPPVVVNSPYYIVEP